RSIRREVAGLYGERSPVYTARGRRSIRREVAGLYGERSPVYTGSASLPGTGFGYLLRDTGNFQNLYQAAQGVGEFQMPSLFEKGAEFFFEKGAEFFFEKGAEFFLYLLPVGC